MSTKSAIEWTDSTWNPVTGCTKVSPGCANCYAERISKRFKRDFSEIRVHPDRLAEPLRWRKPRRVFVNSMSDLFHEDIHAGNIYDIFVTMSQAFPHTFQILTKRPTRMKRLVEYFAASSRWYKWPLPNVWLGVSVEDQKRADERIPLLLQTPAAVRFVSCEPLLGPIHIPGLHACPQECTEKDGFHPGPLPGLDWVIVGGESGPNARPMDLAWAGSIVAQCKAAGVPCFVKQLGAHPFDLTELDQDIDNPPPGTAWSVRTETRNHAYYRLRDHKGGDPSEWPEDLRVREYPR